jgi:glutamine amidotransferase PdxT
MKESRPPFDPGHLKVGVLALQGSFREHLAVLSRIGVQVVEVRLPEQIYDLDGIIIPGGESTTCTPTIRVVLFVSVNVNLEG